jgi:hypothetical protein
MLYTVYKFLLANIGHNKQKQTIGYTFVMFKEKQPKCHVSFLPSLDFLERKCMQICPNECGNIGTLTNTRIQKYARVQTAVKWLQRACWCSANSCRGQQAARRVWATSRIANSCRETAGFCKRIY